MINAAAYIAGVLHGDGWCTERSFGLRCKDLDFSQTFCAAVNDLLGAALSPRLDERGYWLARARNKNGRFSGLRRFAPSNDDDLSGWLRGLFDSEGNAQLWHMPHVGPNSYSRRIAIYSTDLHTIAQASEYLDWLDVSHSIRPTNNSASHKGTKVVFELRMVRRDGFTRFLEMVGSSIARKTDRLQAIVGSYRV